MRILVVAFCSFLVLTLSSVSVEAKTSAERPAKSRNEVKHSNKPMKCGLRCSKNTLNHKHVWFKRKKDVGNGNNSQMTKNCPAYKQRSYNN